MPDPASPVDYDQIRRNLRDVDAELKRELRLAQIAVERGYVTAEQVEKALSEQRRLQGEGASFSLPELLARLGLLSSVQVAELEALHRMESGEKRSADADPSSPRIGKYQEIRRIAHGGMATVYAAIDPVLRRKVALKVLRPDSGATVLKRFHREATIAAQLHHPNIITIHEIGAVFERPGEATHFIAMDYVEGATLADLLREGRSGREELLKILEDVARAVAHAHSKSVLHRDLKPGNILVGRTSDGSGEKRAILSDFGLAHAELFQTHLTRTQSVMGTPQYMAPEQVEGDTRKVDARTDVYALGVILYEILAGRLPFDGVTPAQLYQQILTTDPDRPSRITRGVPPDLEAICLQAMDKDRDRRTASASEFADDLVRFRTGEPISAHAPTLLYVIGKRILRRKALIAAGSLMFALALTIPLVFVPMLHRERGRRLEELQRNAEFSLEEMLRFRRKGDLEEMRRKGGELGVYCRRLLHEDPDLVETHYYLGRMHRALMNDAAALEEQDFVLNVRPAYAPSLYERMVLTAREHHHRMEDLLGEHRIWFLHRSVRESRVELSRFLRDDAVLRDLQRRMEEDVRRLRPLHAELAPSHRACAQALERWVQGDLMAAEAQLQAAVEPSTGTAPEEAFEVLAEIKLIQGDYPASLTWWRKGRESDEGYLFFHLGCGNTLAMLADHETRTGGDPWKNFEDAKIRYERALELDPDFRTARLRLAFLLSDWGSALALRGKDPLLRFEESLRLFEDLEGGSTTQDRSRIHWRRGLVLLNRGQYHLVLREGAKASKDVQEALETFDRIVGQVSGQRKAEALWLRANARSTKLHWFGGESDDPEEGFPAAIRDIEEAVKVFPDRAEVLETKGGVYLSWGDALSKEKHPDWAEKYEIAEEALEEAHRLHPHWFQPCTNLAALHLNRGIALHHSGDNPVSSYEKAIEWCERVLRMNPESLECYRYLGKARQNLGVNWDARKEKEKAVESYREAVEAYEKFIKFAPDLPTEDPVRKDLATILLRLKMGGER